MKKIIILSIALLAAKFVSADVEEQIIKSKIDGVTVYLSGAQINRSGKIKLIKGINRIQFENVSPYLNERTIQVKGTGEYIILDVKKSSKYPEPVKVVKVDGIPKKISDRILRVEDSIQQINYEITDLNAKISFLNIEKDFLLKNNVFTNDSLPIVDKSLAFLREKLFNIHQEQTKYSRKKDKQTKELADLNKTLTDLRNYGSNHQPVVNNNPIHYVEVTVQAKQDVYGTMNISYLVNNAGWSPMYDIRVENTSQPVELTMKANVYQNTGEQWEDINLTLSTNDPFRNKVKPELSVWYLNYYNPNTGYYRQMDKKSKAYAEEEVAESVAKDDFAYNTNTSMPGSGTSAMTSMNYTVKQEMMAHAEYKISLPYTVESNNQAHLVAVNKQTIKGNYFHYLVPRYDNVGYIIAKLTDWEDLDLLPSKANIFYDGSYIGETRINPTANDTLNISLGTDPNLIVKMEKNKEKTKDKVFSNEKEKTISYDLIVKNKGLNNLDVVIEDQVPVATDKSIKIELENKSGASFNEDKGMLTWDFKLKAKGIKTINYTYKVTYDKEKNLNLGAL